MLRKNANGKSRSGDLRQDRNKLILLPIYPLPGHIDIQTNKNEVIWYNKKKTLTLPHAIRISKSQCPAVRRIMQVGYPQGYSRKGSGDLWRHVRSRNVAPPRWGDKVKIAGQGQPVKAEAFVIIVFTIFFSIQFEWFTVFTFIILFLRCPQRNMIIYSQLSITNLIVNSSSYLTSVNQHLTFNSERKHQFRWRHLHNI